MLSEIEDIMAGAARTAAEKSERSLKDMRPDVERVVRGATFLPANPEAPDEAVIATYRSWDAKVHMAASVIRDSDTFAAQLQPHVDAQEEGAAELLEQVRSARVRAYEVMCRLNPEDAWFWTESWQAGEREADANIAAGRTSGPYGAEEFLDLLETWDREVGAPGPDADV
jgi:hypothetical protein